MLPNRSVLGNVALPLEVQGIGKAAREQRALEVIKLVGLDGREHYYPRELSGGQQQRVGIARSLAAEPDIWFLDEPFSALDPLIRREMQDEFMRLQNVLHKSIVFITHDFEEAIRLADRIAIMKDGAIIQIGTPEQLVLNPATSIDRLRWVLDELDLVLLMSVNPGYGGQGFIEYVLQKIEQVRKLIDVSERRVRLEVDGGVKVDNIGRIYAAGADTFVAGSAIFGSGDYAATISAMRAQIGG